VSHPPCQDAGVRVLLTGGSGFVGSYTVPALLERHHDVRLLVRNPEKARDVLGRRGVDVSAVDLVVGDMVDASAASVPYSSPTRPWEG